MMIENSEYTATAAVENRSKDFTSGHKTKKMTIAFTTLLVAIVAVFVDRFVVMRIQRQFSYTEGNSEAGVRFDVVDEEVLSLFVTFDENLDGVLDLSEFIRIANRILRRKAPAAEGPHKMKVADSSSDTSAPDVSHMAATEQLTVISNFTSLVLTSMTKYSDDHSSGFDGNEIQMQGLKSWNTSSVPMATYSVDEFRAFLPYPVLEPPLGQPWHIVESRIDKDGPGLTSNRHYPTPVKGRLAILYKLLSMFHPRPFLLTRFGPQGTVACVRAESKDYLDIVFRIHAEFQLNEPPLLPFWFTPAQFLGNIVIKKDGTHVESFHLAVPNNKSLNVDMEWLVSTVAEGDTDTSYESSGGPGDMEVDIGFLPQMELNSVMPSILPGQQKTDEEVEFTSKTIKWDKEISFDKAYKALEDAFYSFKEVPYVSFEDALNRAKEEKKLVHHILLWGALDDQSC